MPSISAIVPAAGLASRFGGPNKLLQPYKGSTVVGTVVATLLDCGLDVVVVTGRDSAEVSDAVAPARSVFNPRFEEGLGSSIAFGVPLCLPSDGYLIALGDMPGIRPDVVRSLVASLDSPAAIVAPVYEEEPERPGHPVLFGSAYADRLGRVSGDQGAREILREFKANVVFVSVAGSLIDIDEPVDLHR